MNSVSEKSRPRKRAQFVESLRIPGAIAARDLADAVKNRSILLNLVSMTFIMALLKLVPVLWESRHFDIVVYDEGSSSLLRALNESPDYRILVSSSAEEFEELMNDGDAGNLGLVIPPDFDSGLAAGKRPELGGYVLWQHRNRADILRTEYERRLAELTGKKIGIDIEGSVKHEVSSMGGLRVTSLMMVMALFYLGILSVPYLMLEEKMAKTLDSLMLSPASIHQVVLGKALAGMFFVLTLMSVVLAFSWNYVVNWGTASLALFSGALLAVGIGMLMGIHFDSKQKMNSWVLIVSQPLLIPVFLSMIDPIFPEIVRSILQWMPPVAVSLLFRYSFSNGATGSQILTSLAVVLAAAGLILAAVAWKVRRMDQ